MIDGQTVIIVTPMKNEGPYILEWVAHHLSVGFDGFVIFTNDCDDLSDRILDRLARLVPLIHTPNPHALFPDRGNWHIVALRHARLFNLYRDAGWIFHTDADEFLQVTCGDGTLQAFANAAGRFDAVSFTSMPFGSGGVLHLSDNFVTAQFRTLNKPYAALRSGVGRDGNAVKTLFRNAVPFDVRHNHRPRMRGFSASGLRWIDGSGRTLPPAFTDGSAKALNPVGTTDLAQMSHYAIRSAEAYVLKIDGGDAVGAPRLERKRAYWQAYNTPGDAEDRFADKSPAFRAIWTGFMADPALAALHAESFVRHRHKVAALHARPDMARFLRWLGLANGAPA